MIELAEDEQQEFTRQMVEKALKGKTPSASPTLYALVGAPGSGKSTLAKKIKNAVVVSSDDIIAEYVKTLGIDIRDDFYEPEIGLFASKVSNEIYKAAVKNKMDIVYDTAVLRNTEKVMEHIERFGYHAQVKVMLTDEYQAAMNVVERKMDIDDDYTGYRTFREQYGYPSGNPLAVDPNVSLHVSMAVEDFIRIAQIKGWDMEIYEFGKKEPSFKTGDDFDKFVDNLQLMPMEEHINRCERLAKRADRAGREDDFLKLMALKKEMTGRN